MQERRVSVWSARAGRKNADVVPAVAAPTGVVVNARATGAAVYMVSAAAAAVLVFPVGSIRQEYRAFLQAIPFLACTCSQPCVRGKEYVRVRV